MPQLLEPTGRSNPCLAHTAIGVALAMVLVVGCGAPERRVPGERDIAINAPGLRPTASDGTAETRPTPLIVREAAPAWATEPPDSPTGMMGVGVAINRVVEFGTEEAADRVRGLLVESGLLVVAEVSARALRPALVAGRDLDEMVRKVAAEAMPRLESAVRVFLRETGPETDAGVPIWILGELSTDGLMVALQAGLDRALVRDDVTEPVKLTGQRLESEVARAIALYRPVSAAYPATPLWLASIEPYRMPSWVIRPAEGAARPVRIGAIGVAGEADRLRLPEGIRAAAVAARSRLRERLTDTLAVALGRDPEAMAPVAADLVARFATVEDQAGSYLGGVRLHMRFARARIALPDIREAIAALDGGADENETADRMRRIERQLRTQSESAWIGFDDALASEIVGATRDRIDTLRAAAETDAANSSTAGDTP